MHNYLWKVQMWTQPVDLIMRKLEVPFIVKVGLQVVEIGGQYIHVGRDVMENEVCFDQKVEYNSVLRAGSKPLNPGFNTQTASLFKLYFGASIGDFQIWQCSIIL